MQKTAVIYGRVSSAAQAEEELPIEGQVEACRREAQQLGATVLREFIDAGISGRTADHRPAFLEAIAFCKDHQVDLFITWSTSRFARNRIEAPAYKLKLKKHGTNVVFVSNKIDNSTKEGWMMEGILELWDDFQSRTIAEDTSRSMRKNAEDGFFNGGPVPFGYRSVPVGKRRKLEIVEQEAAVVRDVFRRYLDGQGSKSIAMSLNAQGWHRRRVPWSKASAEWTLRNWVYAGYLVYSRHSNADRLERDASQWIKTLAHQPIIEEVTFMEVQKRISARSTTGGKGSPKSSYLFTGLLKCGVCGGAMTIETATGRSKTYSYYNCMKSMKGAGCSSRRIPARDFDDWMVDYIITQVMSHDNLRKIAGEVHSTVVDWAKTREQHRAAMVAELRDVERRRLQLYELMETTDKNALNLGDLSPRLRDLNARTRKLELSLTELEDVEPPQVTIDEADLDSVRDFVREVIAESDNPRKVREFLSGFVDRIIIRDSGADIEFRRDRLVTANATETVHSRKIWGAVPGSLRTAVIIAVLPERFRRAA